MTDLTAFHPAVFGLVFGAFVFQVIAARRAGQPLPLIALGG